MTTIFNNNTVTAMNTIDGVEVYNICDFDPSFEIEFSALGAMINSWAEINNGTYYGACREDFSIYSAVAHAKKLGKSRVVVEDLS